MKGVWTLVHVEIVNDQCMKGSNFGTAKVLLDKLMLVLATHVIQMAVDKIVRMYVGGYTAGNSWVENVSSYGRK